MPKKIALLLQGITEEEQRAMMACGCLHTAQYEKGVVIFSAGSTTRQLGIIQAGHVSIENIDLWGSRRILSKLAPGHVFGETYAITGTPLMVDAIAADDCRVLLLDVHAILHDPACKNTTWSKTISSHLLQIAARKNLLLSARIFQTSFKKARPRIASYLTAIARTTGQTEFDIPFDRQELADYLNLDRSALSKELGRMRDDGILTFHKNHFRLMQQTEDA